MSEVKLPGLEKGGGNVNERIHGRAWEEAKEACKDENSYRLLCHDHSSG